jgi:hypothetical protein
VRLQEPGGQAQRWYCFATERCRSRGVNTHINKDSTSGAAEHLLKAHSYPPPASGGGQEGGPQPQPQPPKGGGEGEAKLTLRDLKPRRYHLLNFVSNFVVPKFLPFVFG